MLDLHSSFVPDTVSLKTSLHFSFLLSITISPDVRGSRVEWKFIHLTATGAVLNRCFKIKFLNLYSEVRHFS